MSHTPRICERQANGTSESAEFRCPECGRTRRLNLKRLGDKAVVCNGEKVTGEKMTLRLAVGEYDAAHGRN